MNLIEAFLVAGKDLEDAGIRVWLLDFGRGVKMLAVGRTHPEAIERYHPLLAAGHHAYMYTDITNLIGEYEASEQNPFTEQNYVAHSGLPGSGPEPFQPDLGGEGGG